MRHTERASALILKKVESRHHEQIFEEPKQANCQFGDGRTEKNRLMSDRKSPMPAIYARHNLPAYGDAEVSKEKFYEATSIHCIQYFNQSTKYRDFSRLPEDDGFMTIEQPSYLRENSLIMHKTT